MWIFFFHTQDLFLINLCRNKFEALCGFFVQNNFLENTNIVLM